MSFTCSDKLAGWHGHIPVEYPADAWIFTSENTMVQSRDESRFKTAGVMFGDVSSMNVVVVGREGDFFLAGAVTCFRSLTTFRVLIESRCVTGIEVRQPEIAPGETPEEIITLRGSDWRELLCRYADTAARKMNVPAFDVSKNITGYCSWYYYYKDVSEANMLENIDALIANRKPYAAEYVQIDDGYQTFQGDWLDQNDSWPTPVGEIARKITSAGMKAGIWIMPTTASTASRVYREHPDWFLKNADGETAVLSGWSPAPDHLWACLDATIPEVREHIAHVFKTFRSMGYTYFKMDGLYFGLQKGIRRDPGATSVSAFRLLLETIRKAVPDAVLLACSEPFMPCLGLVDMGRVSNDTSRSFTEEQPAGVRRTCNCSILAAFNISMSNFWMFDRWFRADPDVIMARQDNAFYTRNEAKFSVLGAIMSGVALTSDHLGTIAPDRNLLLAKGQDIRMRDARPYKSVPNIWPMLFEGTVNGRRAVVAANYGDKTLSWSLEELELPENCIDLLDDKKVFNRIELAPHDAVLLVAAD